MKTPSLGVVVVVGLMLGLTASCSEADPPSADDPASEDGGETADERAADQAAAEAIVLTLDDFPPGWEATPAEENDAEDDEANAAVADCMEVDPEAVDPDYPSAESDDFNSADDETVSSEAAFAPSVEAAEDTMELLHRQDAPECFAGVLQELMVASLLNPEPGSEPPPDDMELGELTVNLVSFADLGDDLVAMRITIPFSAEGFDIEVYTDVVTVRVGRVGITATFQSVLSPFPTDEAERLLEAMIDRVPANA